MFLFPLIVCGVCVLVRWARQIARTTEAARGVGADTSHLYGVRDIGFKPAIALRDAQEQCHSGYAGQLQHAFVRGVLAPIAAWELEVRVVHVVCVSRILGYYFCVVGNYFCVGCLKRLLPRSGNARNRKWSGWFVFRALARSSTETHALPLSCAMQLLCRVGG